jgi:uncharacterized protein YcfJ
MADMNTNTGRTDVPDQNPDAITGAPGSHPVGTGVGAAAAGAAGTAMGMAAGAAAGSVIPGPGTIIGGAIGAVVGAVAGGLAGKGVAEAINPTEEDAYWRGELQNRPYYSQGTDYNEYEPAYRYGYTAAALNQNRSWDDVQNDLGGGWEQYRGTNSNMDWDRAQQPARDAWDRASNKIRQNSSAIRGGNNPD